MSKLIFDAAEVGDLPAIKRTLADNPALYAKMNEAMLIAAAYGRLETVKWSLRAGGASIRYTDKHGESAQNGVVEVVHCLLREGGSNIGEANNVGSTAECGQLETVEWLLKEGGAEH
jgi:hypothetical protein